MRTFTNQIQKTNNELYIERERDRERESQYQGQQKAKIRRERVKRGRDVCQLLFSAIPLKY